MSFNSPVIQAGFEPLPGYVLRKRLGAGGYGEVWLADAPGGLQKAVKLIFGAVDGSQASGELKSLERIRQVNHPFLLSLERIQVVDDRVVIITELAESSLIDRFTYYRNMGAPGIPRSELLEILRDAADVLDYLVDRHSLQHLDIKPGNLLLVAGHVKVGDFGLVKDLKDPNQSLVNGLTPTYSAPELFDGHPDRRSDQYSLAILYVEMLTGKLPFDGSTTGELARQHIHQPPNLDALPPADRPLIARALSKNPLDRYSSCRTLVDQLLKVRGVSLPIEDAVDGTSDSTGLDTGSDAATTPSAKDQHERLSYPTSTAIGTAPDHCFLPKMPVDKVAANWKCGPTMFIGLGGLGAAALAVLREQIESDADDRLLLESHGWLAIDTDMASLKKLTEASGTTALPEESAVHIPLYKPADYQDISPELFQPISRRWLYNIPRNLKTDGVRPLALLAMLDHYESLKDQFRRLFKKLIDSRRGMGELSDPLRVYIIGSLHGGTGSGLLPEIGLLVRRVLSDLQYNDYRLTAAATMGATVNSGSVNLKAACALACLSELDYLQRSDAIAPSLYFKERRGNFAQPKPFDWVTLIDGGLCGDQQQVSKTIYELANSVNLDCRTPAGQALSEARAACLDRSKWLRTSEVATLRLGPQVSARELTLACCLLACHRRLKQLDGKAAETTQSGTPVATDASDVSHGDSSSVVNGDLPLTQQACRTFTSRLLVELGLRPPTEETRQLAVSGKDTELLSGWARRLSTSPEFRQQQIERDCQTWFDSVKQLVRLQVYNWPQIKRLQLATIEELLNYREQSLSGIIEIFAPLSSMFGDQKTMRAQASSYLQQLSEHFVQMIEQFQTSRHSIIEQLQHWSDQLAKELGWDVETTRQQLEALPQHSRPTIKTIDESLQRELNSIICQSLDISYRGLDLLPKLSGKSIGHRNLQALVYECGRNVKASEQALGINGKGEDESEGQSIELSELADFAPRLTVTGGDIHRLVVVPGKQMSCMNQALDSYGLSESTNVISGSDHMGCRVYCDAENLSLGQLLSSLWRPSSKTLQLAERIRTRVDIDWPSIDELLELPLTQNNQGKTDPRRPDIGAASIPEKEQALTSYASPATCAIES